MKTKINKLLNRIKEIIYRRYNISFSQGGGDDIQLYKLLKEQQAGVFVDIGCWHPVKGSNSYYFYLRGWKGICIDPNSLLEPLYDFYRPKDTFVNCAIGNSENEMTYYQLPLEDSAMNTLNFDFVKRNNLTDKIVASNKVPVISLKHVLDTYYKMDERLDFFDIDAEGYDLEVLKTNDWDKYRPKIIMVESNLPIKNDMTSDIVKYLESVDYKWVGKTIINQDLGNLFLINNKKG